MKASSPVKFTRYNTSNNENTGGSDVTTNKKVNSSSPPPPTSLVKSGDAHQHVSPIRTSEIKFSSPVPKYNASMMSSRHFANETMTQSTNSIRNSRIEMKRRQGVQEVTQQILTSFPNQNSKNIDCVLVYEKLAADAKNAEDERSQRKTLAREAFFDVLKQESIDHYEIEHLHDDKVIVFVLLNCSTERLLDEAELTRLDMTLKHSEYKYHDGSICNVSDSYIKSNRKLFEGIDDPNFPDGPFSKCTRSLLCDSILNNIEVQYQYEGQMKTIKGLPSMITDDYFEESFLLHDQTSHKVFMAVMEDFKEQHKDYSETSLEYIDSIFKYFSTVDSIEDPRADLQDNWASMKNIVRFQPLDKIRDYFGEKNAIYFGFVGTFISMLWIPSIVGIIFFICGIYFYFSDESLSFGHGFDNPLQPFYSMFLILWGGFFIKMWKRKNATMAFDWNCDKFQEFEVDLPEYTKMKKIRNKTRPHSKLKTFFYENEAKIKYSVSFLVFLGMACIIGLDIFLTIMYRTAIKTYVFPHSEYGQIIVGEIVAEIINTACIMALSVVYKNIATKLTNWENHRTKSEKDNSLIIKLFSFEFLNSYGYLFYSAHVKKNIHLKHGIFGIGEDFSDECEQENCMKSVSLQLMIILIMFPIPRLLLSLFWPVVSEFFKKKFKKRTVHIHTDKNEAVSESTVNKLIRSNMVLPDKMQREKTILNDNDKRILNEKAVLIYLTIQKEKVEFEDTIEEEYIEKVIMFGFIMLFGSTFTFASLLIVLVTSLDLRTDAYRILWLYKRPVGHRAQNIGVWLTILQFLNMFAIVNQSFMTSFTSIWSERDEFLKNSTLNRFIYAAVYEHVAIVLLVLIDVFLPDVSKDIEEKTRIESSMRRHIVTSIKNEKHHSESSTKIKS